MDARGLFLQLAVLPSVLTTCSTLCPPVHQYVAWSGNPLPCCLVFLASNILLHDLHPFKVPSPKYLGQQHKVDSTHGTNYIMTIRNPVFTDSTDKVLEKTRFVQPCLCHGFMNPDFSGHQASEVYNFPKS